MVDVIAVFIPIVALCIPIAAIVTGHQRKLMEMKLRMGQSVDQSVLAELRAMQNQIAELRDTTTRYDLSFDSALQRIESRVGHLESRVTTLEQTTDTIQIGRNA